MNLIVYIFVLVFSVVFWYRKKYGHRNRLLAQFPAPAKSIPILNNSILLMGKTPGQVLKLFTGLARELGPVWRFDLTPFFSFITIQDPKIVEVILSSQKLLDKSNDYFDMAPWLGTGLLISTGKKWHQRRKIITPTFHFKILEEFVEVMNKHGDVFVKKLKSFDKTPVDIFPMVSLYALDVICESAMGYQLNAQLDDTSEYVKAVKEWASIFFTKFFDPVKRIRFLYQFTNMYRREQELIKRLHDFTDSVISVRRKFLKHRETDSGSVKSADSVDEIGMKKKLAFLDLLLQVKVAGEPLSDESIREEVDTFMFEGHDTTSSAITFILLNLAKHQDIQRRTFDECKEVFGEDLTRAASMADLNKLSYMEKVIKESLRIYPSVPTFSRMFREDEKIGPYTFPANTTIRISPFLMARDPTIFPDPLKFDPSRFEDEKKIRLFSFVPFSAGPRNCIGQKFAMLEMKSIVSKIVRNYNVCVRKEDENPAIAAMLVLRPEQGVDLIFKPRREQQ